MSEKKKKKRKLRPTVLIIPIVLIGLLAGAAFIYVFSMTRFSITVEAGKTVVATDFAARGVKEIYFADGSTEINTKTPGDYWIDIYADKFTRKCRLVVVDTIAPKGVEVDQIRMKGVKVTPEEFVTDIEDATDVVCNFATEPDINTYGDHEVRVFLVDEGGNQSVVVANLTVSKVDLENGYEWEAGDEQPRADFYLLDEGDCKYEGESTNEVDFHSVGEYPVYINVDGKSAVVTLKIVDTVAPKLVCTDEVLNGYIDYPLNPEKFVTDIEDETSVTYSYKDDPDFGTEGEMTATLVATDEGGNTSEATVHMILSQDTEAPVIMGGGPLKVSIGNTVSYREGIVVMDNCDDEVELKIDNSKVDLNTIGSYPVIYSATDHAGNTTSLTFIITVEEENPEAVSMEQMYEEVDKILATILKDDMTDKQKAEAIYYWTRNNIYFVDHTEKEDWVKSAYEGITTRHGDCFTYASVAKAMLTRVGIPNIDVKRNSVLSFHIWNLIDVGEGWYHFDATPRSDKTIVFYWSETQLCADEPVRRSHVYDRSLYPEVHK